MYYALKKNPPTTLPISDNIQRYKRRGFSIPSITETYLNVHYVVCSQYLTTSIGIGRVHIRHGTHRKNALVSFYQFTSTFEQAL